MTTPAPHPTTADHRAELLDAALHVLEQQLPSAPIMYVWPERHRVLFHTADGRTGDVEVLLNWDVMPTESPATGDGTP